MCASSRAQVKRGGDLGPSSALAEGAQRIQSYFQVSALRALTFKNWSCPVLLHQLLDAGCDLLPLTLAPGNHQHRIISGDRADDLGPAGVVQCLGDRSGRATGGLENQKRA